MKHKHPIIAAIYDRMMASEERAFLTALRDRVVSLAQGTVVEIGAGTGRNFAHYRPGSVKHLHAVEPDPYMRRRAEPRAAELDFSVELLDAVAEKLPWADAFADCVVCTLVLCSVDRPEPAIAEMRRVLKPGGRLLFIEHVRSDQPWRARLEDCVTVLWPRVAGNCHPNRPTVALIRQAGFQVQEIDRVTCHAPFSQPMIAGVASSV